MEQKRMPESEATAKWMKEHTVFIGIKLMKTTDADILAALNGKAKQTEIKRLLRIALEVERKNKEEK